MIYYNEYLISKKVINRIIYSFETTGNLSSSLYEDFVDFGFSVIYNYLKSKLSVYIPQSDVIAAKSIIVSNLTVKVFTEILKRSLITGIINSDVDIKYTSINNRVEII